LGGVFEIKEPILNPSLSQREGFLNSPLYERGEYKRGLN